MIINIFAVFKWSGSLSGKDFARTYIDNIKLSFFLFITKNILFNNSELISYISKR